MCRQSTCRQSTSRKAICGKTVLALALALGLAAAAGATTLIPVTATELTDGADAIVTGTAVYSEVVTSGNGAFPFTYVTFQIHQTFKGRVIGNELTLRLHGGEMENREVVVQGMPRFEVGETYLLFVRNNGQSASPLMGWVQGQMHFGKEPRSGESILVDYRDRAVLGLEAGRFTFSDKPVAAPGEIAPGVKVLAEESVQILAADPDAGKPSVPAVGEVLEQLADFVAERSSASTYVPGRIVVSARPSDVPFDVGIQTVAPRSEVQDD